MRNRIDRTAFPDCDGGISAERHCHTAWVAGAGIVAGLIGGLSASRTAKNAGNQQLQASREAAAAQLQASREANQLLQNQFNQTQATTAPYLQSGQAATAALMQGLGLGQLRAAPGVSMFGGGPVGGTPPGTYTNAQGQPTDAQGNVITANAPLTNYGATQADLDAAAGSIGAGAFNQSYAPTEEQLLQDPSYLWRLSQGQRAIEAGAAARGGLLTGQGGADLLKYAQGLASTEYGNVFERNRQQSLDRYNQLAALSGGGQQVATNLANAGANNANALASNITGGAGAASNYLTSGVTAAGQANIAGQNAITSGLQGGINNWTTLQYLNGRNQITSNPTGTGVTQPVYTGPTTAPDWWVNP
jgi:hypothetical protein